MLDHQHIVIVGGGYGGILTAKKIEKKYRKNKNISITLIDKNSYHTMLTELHEVAAGRIPEDAIRINFDKIFANRHINVVLDNVQSIDFKQRIIHGEETCYAYDYLVLATGSQPTFYGTEGAAENAFTLWSYEDAVKIKHHIWNVFGRASVETNPVIRRGLLTFVVIGCGFTGIEMIGELAEWCDRLCQTFNISSDEVRLIIADLMPKVLPSFDEKLAYKTIRRLEKMKVEILLNSPIKRVDSNSITIEGKGQVATETVIWAAGIKGSALIEKFDENKVKKQARHRVVCDAYLRAKGQDNVFVVGDNIFYIVEGQEHPVPQMVENAEHSSALVSKNIIASLSNNPLTPYKPAFHGAMVSIGGRYSVAQVGTPKKQFVFAGFIAMFIKHAINCVYFFQVAGFNKFWTYLMHQFFYVPDRRSFLGGHFAKASPNFWVLPLRLFLGFSWLKEGLAKLPSILLNPNKIFLIPQKVVDGVSAASEPWVDYDALTSQILASGYPQIIKSWMRQVLVVDAQNVTHTGQALAVPTFITNIVDWSMNLLFYTDDGGFTILATVFQTGMVVAEIGVGLALMIGFMTAPLSVVSLIMAVMIWASGMAPPTMMWYMAAGIATIGGSGSTFGLDYYLLPRLKKGLKRIPFIKKWYLYTDDI